MSNESLDYVLCYCDTITLKTPKSREKNEGRRYLDYCGIITTEYKWTTKFKNVCRIKTSIKAENFNFKIQSFNEVNKIREMFNHFFVLFYRKNRYSKPFVLVSNVEG